MLPRLTPELPKSTSASRSLSRMRSRASPKRRSISPGENLSHICELLSDPVRDERPVLVRDVVANVGALLEQDEPGVGRLGGDPARLLPRDDPVELAGHHECRLAELADDRSQVELERLFSGRLVVTGARVVPER